MYEKQVVLWHLEMCGRCVYVDSDKLDNKSDKADAELTLPVVKKGDDIKAKKINLKKGKTKPPPLYSEAGILGAMG